MTIAILKKLTLIGEVESKVQILSGLQELGVVHLVALAEHADVYTPSDYERQKEALAYLDAAPAKRRLQQPKSGEIAEAVNRCLENKIAREEVLDQLELYAQRRKELKPWGEFEYSPLSDLAGFRLWFYKIPLSKKKVLASLELPWQIVNEDHNYSYVLVIAEVEPTFDQVPIARIHVGNLSLSELEQEFEKAQVRLEDLNAERESLTRWILPLRISLNDAVDQAELQQAAEMSFDSTDCFVVQGWIPEEQLSLLEGLRQQLPMAYQTADVDEAEEPPTLLQNSNRYGGGEEAVAFFQLPGYRSWDPSLLIFFSFSLFFAMILSDAGYAFMLALILAAFWNKSGRTDTGIRIRNLTLSLIGTSIVYGVLVGSYFGVTPAESTFLGHLHLINMDDFSAMMKLSIGAGVFHLILANSMVAWTERKSLQALSSVGWVLVIGFSFLMWLEYLKADAFSLSASANSSGIMVGILLILLFTSARKVTRITDAGARIFDGTKALYGLSKAFGDALSYMRLFALGLSSASLAVTFNTLAIEARDSVSAGGGILFLLILIFGHGLNFVLGIMSGVIHGLRLNLLEFYNWGVKGEGYPFKAFKKRG